MFEKWTKPKKSLELLFRMVFCLGKMDSEVKTFNGQRVVIFENIDNVHQRSSGTVRRNFNINQKIN